MQYIMFTLESHMQLVLLYSLACFLSLFNFEIKMAFFLINNKQKKIRV